MSSVPRWRQLFISSFCVLTAGSGKCKRPTYFPRSHLSAGPQGEGETLPVLWNTAMLATTESDSSTSLLIDLLEEFTQWQLLHEPNEPCCCGNFRESFILRRSVDGPGTHQAIRDKHLVPERAFPVKLAAWTSLGIRFVPLEEAICIANDSSSPCNEASAWLFRNTCLWNG